MVISLCLGTKTFPTNSNQLKYLLKSSPVLTTVIILWLWYNLAKISLTFYISFFSYIPITCFRFKELWLEETCFRMSLDLNSILNSAAPPCIWIKQKRKIANLFKLFIMFHTRWSQTTIYSIYQSSAQVGNTRVQAKERKNKSSSTQAHWSVVSRAKCPPYTCKKWRLQISFFFFHVTARSASCWPKPCTARTTYRER